MVPCTKASKSRVDKSNKGDDMKKLVTIAVTIALGIALLGARYHARAEAGNARPNSPVKWSGPIPPPISLANHTLTGTYIDEGDLVSVVGSGFQPVDTPVTITCGNSAGCTIGAEHWLQVGGQSATGNRWAICTEVDGTVQFLCPFQGYVPSDGSYATGSFNLAVAVTQGTHTVQEVLYTDDGAEIGDYNNTYHRYKP
jgi:hypothetical protein